MIIEAGKPFEPKRGDEVMVHVRGKIVRADPSVDEYGVNIEIYSDIDDDTWIMFRREHIFPAEPRKPCVGDVVTWGHQVDQATVLGLSDNQIALQYPNKGYMALLDLPLENLRIVSRASQEKKG